MYLVCQKLTNEDIKVTFGFSTAVPGWWHERGLMEFLMEGGEEKWWPLVRTTQKSLPEGRAGLKGEGASWRGWLM